MNVLQMQPELSRGQGLTSNLRLQRQCSPGATRGQGSWRSWRAVAELKVRNKGLTTIGSLTALSWMALLIKSDLAL